MFGRRFRLLRSCRRLEPALEFRSSVGPIQRVAVRAGTYVSDTRCSTYLIFTTFLTAECCGACNLCWFGRAENRCSVETRHLFAVKNATTATSRAIFETSKSPLRKSPNLQIPNPLYLCRFPDDSGRQATTDYSGLNPTLSAISCFLMKLVDSELRLSISTVTRPRGI